MISKNNKSYYTNGELELAKENNNALEYVLNQGYQLVKAGNYFHLKEHDSLVFSPDGKYHWNSKGIKGGDAISFIQNYEGRDYKDAVIILSGALGYVPSPSVKETVKNLPKEKKPLEIPSRAPNNDTVINYLTNIRGVSKSLVSKLISEQKIYQSKKYSNVVMVGFDKDNKPKYIANRSTNEKLQKPYKLDCVGSDKSYPFVINGEKGNNTLCVFESPIEAMSYLTLCDLMGSDKTDCTLISLGCTATNALDRYLEEHPNIKNIVIGLNNDANHDINAGLNGTKKVIEKYSKVYNVTVHKPHLNDWNDVLKNFRKNHMDKKLDDIQKQHRNITKTTKAKGIER